MYLQGPQVDSETNNLEPTSLSDVLVQFRNVRFGFFGKPDNALSCFYDSLLGFSRQENSVILCDEYLYYFEFGFVNRLKMRRIIRLCD
jgi:hypothetical protein